MIFQVEFGGYRSINKTTGGFPPEFIEGGRKMWLIIIINALVVMFLVLTARSFLKEECDDEKKSLKDRFLNWLKKSPSGHIADSFKHVTTSDFFVTVIVGLLTGGAFYFVLNYGLVAKIVVLLVGLVAMSLLVVWWIVEGSDFKEMLPFIGLLAMNVGLVATAAVGIAGATGEPWRSVLQILPWLSGIVALAFILYNYFSFHCTTMDSEDGVIKLHRIGAWATLAGAIVLALVLIVVTVVSASSANSTSNTASSYAGTGDTGTGDDTGDTGTGDDTGEKSGMKEIQYLDCVHFRNSDLQNDSDKSNDYNLGYDHWEPGRSVDYYVSDRKTAYSGENGEKIDTLLLAEMLLNYDKYLKQDNAKDLLYICTDGKALKALGTVNAVSQALSTNQELLDKAIALVDSTQVKAKSRIEKLKIQDQVYVQPDSLLGRPKLVVYKSDVKEDWCLIDTFEIKGKKIEIAYRIRCGYQTCNVAKVYGLGKVTPTKPKPPKKPEKPGKGGSDKPKPKPKDKPKKDQTKRSALPNDKKGPGKNTIDPKDYEHSSEDTGDSTTSTTPEQYHNDNKDKGDAGKNQNTGGGSTDPSTDTGGAKDNHGSDADRKTDTSGGTAAGKDSDGKVDEPS